LYVISACVEARGSTGLGLLSNRLMQDIFAMSNGVCNLEPWGRGGQQLPACCPDRSGRACAQQHVERKVTMAKNCQ
jgi:uncharacterized repeat protein (TIGR04076 family)